MTNLPQINCRRQKPARKELRRLSLVVRFINRQAMTLDMEWMDHQMNNKLTISPQLPQRWITEITPDGVVRHVQKIGPEHIVIHPSDIPGLISDRLIVSDHCAEAVHESLVCRFSGRGY